MHKYIWRQFSSNHSGQFTVVGMFATAEQAAQAATTIRQILTTIAEWYQQNGYDHISPLEHHFAEQYGLDTDIDPYCALYAADAFDRGIDHAVTHWERLVFVVTEYTWNLGSAHPLLMDSLKSMHTVLGYGGDGWSPLRLWLDCTAPDAATALHIADTINNYLEASRNVEADDYLSEEWVACPWSKDPYDDHYTRQFDNEHSFVLQSGVQLRFNLCFLYMRSGLMALVEYLQAQDCDHFDYYIREWHDEGFDNDA